MAAIPVTPLIGGTTPFAAITTQRLVDLSAYEWGALSCKLAGAEEVDIYTLAGPDWVLATDESGNVKKLTNSIPKLRLEGGIVYGVLKDQTTVDVQVWLELGPGLRR